MEHAQNVIGPTARFEWDDLGSWTALAGISSRCRRQCAVAIIMWTARAISSTTPHQGPAHTIAVVGFARFDSVQTDDAVCCRAQIVSAKGQGTGQKTWADAKLKKTRLTAMTR